MNLTGKFFKLWRNLHVSFLKEDTPSFMQVITFLQRREKMIQKARFAPLEDRQEMLRISEEFEHILQDRIMKLRQELGRRQSDLVHIGAYLSQSNTKPGSSQFVKTDGEPLKNPDEHHSNRLF